METEKRLNALAERQTRLQTEVTSRAQAISAELATTGSLLAQANGQVRELAAEVEAQRAAADHAAFAAQLLEARQLTGSAAVRAVQPSTVGAGVLAAAAALSGHPYQWGGTGPVGYDCSGMVGAAYSAVGLRLPRTAAQQYLAGQHPSLGALQPGDLLFWASNAADPQTIEHVAVYAGGDLMVSADHTGDVVRLQPIWWSGFVGATRPAAAAVDAQQRAPGQMA